MTQAKLFATGMNEQDAPTSYKPPESTCAHYRAKILAALQSAGDSGVSGMLMRELCPQSATQRISEVRAELEKRGLTVRCQRTGGGGSVYTLQPYKIGE